MAKIGKQSFSFEKVYILETATVVGPKEKEGPLGSFFDKGYEDLHIGEESSWEKAEMRLLDDAINICLKKANMKVEDIDMFIGGDLNNQLVIENYVLRNYDLPYIGVFGACSTSSLSIIVGSNFMESKNAKYIMAGTSSHNSTAERQFRYPTEYGGQRPDTITSTVTGSGVVLLTKVKTKVRVSGATIGRVIDVNMKDSLDMGRVMAPSAFDTINIHLNDFKRTITDYDLIVTGDLSYYGMEMLVKIFDEYDMNLRKNYSDCGVMIYSRKKQNVFAGGSGCGCCAVVTFGYLYQCLLNKRYKRILVVATGALHNPIIIAQNESIPAVSHAIVLERCEIV